MTDPNANGATASLPPKGRKLPAFFQFYFLFLPFIYFLFEFTKPGVLFTDYQIYASVFLAIAYVVAIFGLNMGLARICFAAGAFLIAPPLLTKLYVVLVGAESLNADIVYYGTHYVAIAAVLYYLFKSGLGFGKLYFSYRPAPLLWLITSGLIAATLIALKLYFNFIPRAPGISIGVGPSLSIPTVALFAIANGAMEELWFRSILLGTLVQSFPSGFAVVYQALLFGLIHWDGIPSGGVGIALAFIFGAALGWLTVRSRSIMPALCIHIAADFAIGLYL